MRWDKNYGERLDVFHTLSRPSGSWTGSTGRLDESLIKKLTEQLFMQGDNRHKQYFLCGPQAMMDTAFTTLEKQGVNTADIHQEYYSAKVPSEGEVAEKYGLVGAEEGQTYELTTQTVKILLDDEWEEVTVEPNESILDAAISANLGAPFSCQSGICTTCRAKVLKGVVEMDESDGLAEDEIEEGYVLSCQAHPMTADVEISFDE
jgi:ring-1,2-phenylacetyl-CoA epoxidase subunit PaaE